MTLPPPLPSNFDHHLLASVLRFKELQSALSNEHDETSSRYGTLTYEWHRSFESISTLMNDDLHHIARHLARRWFTSGWAQNLTDIIDNLRSMLFLALYNCHVDSEQNIHHYLYKTLSYRGKDGPEKVSRKGKSYHSVDNYHQLSTDISNSSGQTYHYYQIVPLDDIGELVDSDASEIEEYFLREEKSKGCVLALIPFLEELPEIDQRIVVNRWIHDPPTSYTKILTSLGPGWTEETLRTRKRRLKQRIQKYFENRGLHECFFKIINDDD